jgi:hypothetical protein
MSASRGVTHNARVSSTVKPRRDRSESGDTLVEVLLALIILSMASVALIIAFGTSLSASSTHRTLATFDTVLTSTSQDAISLIQQDSSLFVNCPATQSASGTAAIYQANPLLALSVPSPYTSQFQITYTSVQYWDTTSNTFDNNCVVDTFQPELIMISALNTLTGATFTNSFVVDYPVTTSQESDAGQAASQLTFLAQPTLQSEAGTAAGTPLATQPIVEVLGATGAAVTTDLSPVTLTLNGGNADGSSNGATLQGCLSNEVLGVITFTGCTVSAQGVDYTITASVGTGDSSSTTVSDITTSSPFSVSAAAGSLTFAGGEPVAGTSGSVFTTTPVVTVVGDTTFTGNITVTVSGGTLSNCTGNSSTTPNVVTLPATTTAGVTSISLAGCTFAGTDYYNVANSLYTPVPYTLTATAAALLPATSNVFTVSGVGPAAQLVFSTEPTGVGSSSASTAFSGQPAITVEDSYGNVITNPTATVALSISSGTTLGGATVPETLSNCTSSIVNKVAITFTGCAGSAYANGLTLTATTTTGTTFTVTSTSFNITGAASQLVFAVQPAAGASGTAFTTEPVINVEDASGNIVTAATAQITLTTSGGALLYCSSLAPNQGVVTVTSCTFSGLVGTSYTMTASESGLTSATSTAFSPTIYGAASKLVFTTNPTAGLSGSTFTTQPVIKVEDSGGNVVTNSSTQITLTASPASLVGLQSCTGLQAVAGVIDVAGCTFGGLVNPPNSYTLTAAPVLTGSLKSATSGAFSPTGPGPASSSTSTVVASPSLVKANGLSVSTITVTLMDASDNPISGKSISISPNGGTQSTYTTGSVVTNSSGVATFSATDGTVELVTYTATDTTDSVVIGQTAAVNFISVPTITGISPASRGQSATNQNLTLTGTNFVNGAVVTFANSGITVNSTTFNSATSLTVNVTVAANASLGTSTVTETNPDTGTFTSGSIFTVNAAPTVTAVSPTSLNQGATSQALTVSGTGFVSGATPTFSGTGITVNSTTFVNATTLTVNVTIAGGATVGSSTITVTNPDAGNGTSGAIFTVNPAPTITGVSPSSLNAGAVNQSLTVTGTDFVSGASLATAFSGSNITVLSTTFVNATTLTVNVSISSGAATGPRTFTVANGDGSIATSGSIFTVNAAPTVTAVSPTSLAQGATNQSLTITGTDFVSGASLATVFSGTGITVNSTTLNSATSLTVNISITGGAPTGTRVITVTNGDGSIATSGSIFTVNAAPTVTAVSPTSRGQGATSQNLTVSGTGFESGATATFSNTGITVNSTTYVSATSLTVNVTIAGNATVGSGTITVMNPDDGSATSGSIFTVNTAPSPVSVSPSSLNQGAISQTLTLTGTGFVSGATTTFSGTGITVNSTTFVNSTTLTVNVTIAGGATVGSSTITVTNPDAGNSTSGSIFTVNAAPTITGVSPASRDQGAVSQNLTVTGTDFVNGASLATVFSGTLITVNSTTYVNSTTLTVNVSISSSAATGTRTFTVTNGDRSTATSGSIFTVSGAPTVTAVSPTSRGQGATNQTLTITGTNFVSGATTAFSTNGITVNSTTFNSATSLTVNVSISGSATPGTRTITVTNGDGSTATSGSIFTVNAAPTVTAVSPTSRGEGATAQNLTVTGTGFQSGATTTFSGTGITVNSTTFVNATTLTVNVTIGGSATVGTSTITVTNPDAGSATSGSIFTVNAAPTVTAVSPTSRDAGAVSQSLTVTGTGFVSGATTSFSGSNITVNSTTFVNATTLTVNISISSGALVGTRAITVTNPDAGNGTSGSIFTVNAAPTVTAVSPTSRDAGAVNQNLTITGTNFITGATVAFSTNGITVNSTTFNSATSLSVNISIASGATVGTRTITVTNGDGSVVTSGSIFTVNAAPTVTAVSPSSRAQGTSNQSLTVTGTNFITGATATFSATGITVNSTTFVSATSLTVNVTVASNAATGAGTISVLNGDGSTATSGSIFTVNPPPTATSVSPSSLDQGAISQALTLTGTGFESGATVLATGSGVTVNSTAFVNSTTLTVTVSVNGGATIASSGFSVTNPDAGTVTSGAIFSVTAAPTVTAVSPTSRGAGAVSQNLTVTGTGFVTGTSLATVFSGTNITVNSTTYVSSTSLTVNISIAAGAAIGTRTFTVTNGDRSTATSGSIFTVNVAPTVTGVSPNTEAQSVTVSVTVTGTGFVAGASLATVFSGTGVTVNSTTYVSATSLTVNITVSASAPNGTHTITVTNGDGGTATSGSIFTVT